MSDPEPLAGPIQDVLKRLEQISTDMKLLTEHVNSSVTQYEHLCRLLDDLDARTAVVESKTFSLAVQPRRKNCVNCTKIMPDPRAMKCGLCGAAQPQ